MIRLDQASTECLFPLGSVFKQWYPGMEVEEMLDAA
jgi:hypothetical protein